jgi:hypothetical protein
LSGRRSGADDLVAAPVLIGDVPRSMRLRGLRHPLLGVAQNLLGRAAAVGVVVLLGPLVGHGHSTTGYTIFWYVRCHTCGYPGLPIDNRGSTSPQARARRRR